LHIKPEAPEATADAIPQQPPAYQSQSAAHSSQKTFLYPSSQAFPFRNIAGQGQYQRYQTMLYKSTIWFPCPQSLQEIWDNLL